MNDLFNCETQLDRIEAKLDVLLARKKPKKSLLTEWIVPAYIDEDIWKQYLQLRKEKRSAMQESTYKQQLKKFAEWHKQKVDVNAILLRSVENGWVGLFPDKPLSKDPATIESATHDGVDFIQLRNADKLLDPVDPYADLKS